MFYRLIKHPVYPRNHSALNPQYYSKCSKYPFHSHRPEVSCAIHQQHRPQCFAISHSKCQSSAVSDRPRRELVSDTHDPASRPTFDSQLHSDQGYWEAICLEEWILEFHAAGARSSDVHGELSQKQQIKFPKVVQQQHIGEVDKSITVVLQINSV